MFTSFQITIEPWLSEVNEIHLGHQFWYFFDVFFHFSSGELDILILILSLSYIIFITQNLSNNIKIITKHEVVGFDIAVDDADVVQLSNLLNQSYTYFDDIMVLKIEPNIFVKVFKTDS